MIRARLSTFFFLFVLAAAPGSVLAQEIAGHAEARLDHARQVEASARSPWKGALRDSLELILVEHTARVVFQGKTRRALSGPFLRDYSRSIRIPRQWHDEDSWNVNYVGHPVNGAAAGYIWLNHDPAAPSEFSATSAYWSSRMRAMAWAAAFSLQFEIGPLSEASIGNVGMHPARAGWVDHIVTPIGGFGLIVAGDALDRYVVSRIEAGSGNAILGASLRILLNPGRALSNATNGKSPWYREDRPLGSR